MAETLLEAVEKLQSRLSENQEPKRPVVLPHTARVLHHTARGITSYSVVGTVRRSAGYDGAAERSSSPDRSVVSHSPGVFEILLHCIRWKTDPSVLSE
ncbi:hypothetical protein EOD39_21616 [Acipenser ruthenus]|uniref:Uncharacterized protein n=1 Tax=Acipenser ruthenus TaxID=7906 RepID=A0A444US67_ACIRT|nr:hypothetical protein EOD39_21616 [Acipenser ruthenus]